MFLVFMNNITTEDRQVEPDLLKTRRWLRVREYCELTGTPLGTAYKYVAEGIVESVRIGSTIRIPCTAVTELGSPR
jgi:excisionase family DNA binding protein